MGEKVVETYNIFLNSDDAINNGQNYDFQFGNNIVQTRNKAQSIRLSVSNFNMVKTWCNVNQYNNGLILRSALGFAYPFNVPISNYASINNLAIALAIATATAVQFTFAAFGAVTHTLLAPLTTGINTTETNQIQFQLNTANPHGLVAADLINGNFALQTIIDPQNIAGFPWPFVPGSAQTIGGDSGLLLGTYRLPSTSLLSSFVVLITGPNTIFVTSPYPAQRFTEPNVYIRANPSPLVLASEGFDAPLRINQDNALNPSTILAEIRVDTEMVQFEPPNDRQFFAIFNQPTLGHIQVSLTDSRGRPLPLFNADQETIGNRNFTITLRVDILEKAAYSEIKPPEIQMNTQATNDNVQWRLRMGQSNYARPMGY